VTRLLLRSLVVAVPLLLAACGQGQDHREPARVRLALLGRFDQPTYLTAPPGDRRRRFVVEREGRIRIVRNGRKLRRPFLSIPGQVQTGGESGMLSMAFAPDYARSRRYYVYYVDNAGRIAVDQFRRSARSPNRTQPGSQRRVIRIPHQRFNHKGGQVAFGHDGLLYLGTGDGGGGGDPDRNAQNRAVRSGRSCGSGRARTAATPCRGRIRSRAAAGRGARSSPTACGTRGASRSTAAAARS
jgi:glucose/arabinose dehydrogenase